MNSPSTDSILDTQKIWYYFTFILAPFEVKSVIMLEEGEIKNEESDMASLLQLLVNQNINCFKLCIDGKNNIINLYYIDIETPIVFYLTSSKIINSDILKEFWNISKGIRYNLINHYSQELEINLLYWNPSQSSNNNQFIVYRVEDQELKSENAKIQLKNGKRKSPFGKFSIKNKINLLTGREWIRFTKSWLIVRPPRRSADEILHPAKFPEVLVRKFICFFTRPGEIVLDPFLGSGSTLVAAKQCNRSAIGIEIAKKYLKIAQDRLNNITISSYPPIYTTNQESFWNIIKGDSAYLRDLWKENNLSTLDFVITSPPYWSQLDRNEMRQQDRREKGLDTQYSSADPKDLASIVDYKEFLKRQQTIFDQIYELMKPKGYLVVITNNVFTKGKLYPLAYDTAKTLGDGKWTLKDEKIWLQDDKRLLALGVNNAWVGNRCHQYCLIFRKEE
jgi:DNA modification methylase